MSDDKKLAKRQRRARLSQIRALLKRVERLLWEEWDPIGANSGQPVSEFDSHDEYDSFALPVLRMALRGASVETIAAYLDGIEVECMELRDAEQESPRNKIVAAKVLDIVKAGV